jgi:hypothetical protein
MPPLFVALFGLVAAACSSTDGVSVSVGGNYGGSSGSGGAGPDAGSAGTGGGSAGARPDASASADAGTDTATDAATDTAIDAADAAAHRLTIRFDYRYDKDGFFTDPLRRALLEHAASHWTLHLANDFETVPAGTTVLTRDPQAPAGQSYTFPIEQDIDDLLVFVASTNLDGVGGDLAGSTSTAAIGSVTDPALRAELNTRYTGAAFQPWTGWLSVDNSEPWFFDPTPEDGGPVPADQIDFVTVMQHELGHILGVNIKIAAYAAFVTATTFVGPSAEAVNGGPVPLATDQSHIAKGVTVDGARPSMDPSTLPGERRAVSRLDLALLADIGYRVVP